MHNAIVLIPNRNSQASNPNIEQLSKNVDRIGDQTIALCIDACLLGDVSPCASKKYYGQKIW